ncbi:hypothetical protein [Phytohabitans houttuyneae]|nr:hypothetical protein [Phytohabitans houttuyneae]
MHLVEYLDEYPLGHDWTAVTLGIAGGDLGTFRPLTDIRKEERFGDVLESIVRSMDGLNPEFEIERITTGAFLTRLLGDRQSTIRDRLTRLNVDARLLPLVLLDDQRLAAHQLASVLVGRVHGDLNEGNIVLPTKPRLEPDRFILLDADHYATDGIVAYDAMHLLVAIAVNSIVDARLGAAGRDDIIQIIVNPDALPTTSSPLVTEFQRISQAVHRGCDARPLIRGYGHYWRHQKLLALVAIGLIHTSRDLPGDDPDAARQWCLALATEAAKVYLATIGQHHWYVPTTQSVTGPAPAAEQVRRKRALRQEAFDAVVSNQMQGVLRTRLARVRRAGKSGLQSMSRLTRAAIIMVIVALVGTIAVYAFQNRSPGIDTLDLVYVMRPFNQPYQVTIKQADGKTHRIQAKGPVKLAERIPSGWVIGTATTDVRTGSQGEEPTRIVMLSNDGTERELITTTLGGQPVINRAATRILIHNAEKGTYDVYDLPGGSHLGEARSDEYFGAGFAGNAVIMARHGAQPTWYDVWVPEAGPFDLVAQSEKFNGFVGSLPGGRALFTQDDCLLDVKPLESMRILRRMCKLGDLNPATTSFRLSSDGRWLIGAIRPLTQGGQNHLIVARVEDLLKNATVAGELPLTQGFTETIFLGPGLVLFKTENDFTACVLDKRVCERQELPMLDGQSPFIVRGSTTTFDPDDGIPSIRSSQSSAPRQPSTPVPSAGGGGGHAVG